MLSSLVIVPENLTTTRIPRGRARDGPPQAPEAEGAHAAVQQVLLQDLRRVAERGAEGPKIDVSVGEV